MCHIEFMRRIHWRHDVSQEAKNLDEEGGDGSADDQGDEADQNGE